MFKDDWLGRGIIATYIVLKWLIWSKTVGRKFIFSQSRPNDFGYYCASTAVFSLRAAAAGEVRRLGFWRRSVGQRSTDLVTLRVKFVQHAAPNGTKGEAKPPSCSVTKPVCEETVINRLKWQGSEFQEELLTGFNFGKRLGFFWSWLQGYVSYFTGIGRGAAKPWYTWHGNRELVNEIVYSEEGNAYVKSSLFSIPLWEL